MSDDSDNPLGPCCICEGTAGVKTAILLELKNQEPGRGWGCFVCGLSCDGACAVLCDWCAWAFESGVKRLRFACRGYPGLDGRVPIDELVDRHAHDASRHVVIGSVAVL